MAKNYSGKIARFKFWYMRVLFNFGGQDAFHENRNNL